MDNWKAFNKYPWGKICYKRTLFGLERDLANRVSKFQDKNKEKEEVGLEAYSLVGFAYAFQIWAYEAILLLELKYATRVSQGYPRMLNWCATSAPRATDVEKMFSNHNVSTFHDLEIIRIQLYTLYYFRQLIKVYFIFVAMLSFTIITFY